jgi:hypothetical protein
MLDSYRHSEDEGTLIFQDVRNCSLIHTTLHPRTLESSATLLCKPQILQLSKFCLDLCCLSVLGHKFDNVVINQGPGIFPPHEVQMVELSQWHPEATNRIWKLFVQLQNILQTYTTSSVTCTYS